MPRRSGRRGRRRRGPLAPPASTASVRIEHWDNAQDQGAHAARTLLADLDGGRGEPFAPVPWFWSDQYDRKVQVAGRTSGDAGSGGRRVRRGPEVRRPLRSDDDAGTVTAVLGMNMRGQAVMRWRARIVKGLTWAEALATD